MLKYIRILKHFLKKNYQPLDDFLANNIKTRTWFQANKVTLKRVKNINFQDILELNQLRKTFQFLIRKAFEGF